MKRKKTNAEILIVVGLVVLVLLGWAIFRKRGANSSNGGIRYQDF